MQSSEATKVPMEQKKQKPTFVLSERLLGRNGLIVVAILAIGGGFYLNWNWLVAAGLAPLILGVLPCVAMCALGLCASKMTGGNSSCSSSETPPKAADTTEPSLAGGSRHTS